MVKRLAIFGLLLAVLVAVPFSSASTDSFEAGCADAHLWLSSAIPPGLLEFVCAVYEGGSPITVEFGDESVLFQQNPDAEEYRLTIQELELPEKTKQQLLLLLILWSQDRYGSVSAAGLPPQNR